VCEKAIGSSILEIDLCNELIEHYAAINGPSGEGKCSGMQDCGCSHAESRVLMKYLKHFKRIHRESIKRILISTCLPCMNCANIIIDSELIDVVAYTGIYYEYDDSGFEKLDKSFDVRLWSKSLIEEDIANYYIKSWLSEK